MKYEPGFWRDIRPLDLFGIPAPLFLIYLFWCRWPSMMTIYLCTAVLAVFRLMSFFGWTVQMLSYRLFHLVRGNRLSGRLWWYRRLTE